MPHVIRAMRNGKRYVLTLAVQTENEAAAERLKFEHDPEGYALLHKTAKALRAAPKPEPVKADTWDHIDAWSADMTKRGRTPVYIRCTNSYVRQWRDALRRPLEACSLALLTSTLEQWTTAVKDRVIALKSFTAFLRTKGLLDRKNDPTLDFKNDPDLFKPTRKPSERSYSKELVEKTYSLIYRQDVRDLFRFRAMTGCHTTELRRIAADKNSLQVVNDGSGIYGVARFEHKNGTPHALSLDKATYFAAMRLQALESLPSNNGIGYCLQSVSPGFVIERLRHTFATLAPSCGKVVKPQGNTGVDHAAVAQQLGHSVATANKYYRGDTVPDMIRIPYKLHHTDDPVLT